MVYSKHQFKFNEIWSRNLELPNLKLKLLKKSLVQATSTRYCKNRASCDKNMKFGSVLPYTKTIKTREGDNQSTAATAVHRLPGAIKPSWGRPIG